MEYVGGYFFIGMALFPIIINLQLRIHSYHFDKNRFIDPEEIQVYSGFVACFLLWPVIFPLSIVDYLKEKKELN